MGTDMALIPAAHGDSGDALRSLSTVPIRTNGPVVRTDVDNC